jgi:hypothetical protein
MMSLGTVQGTDPVLSQQLLISVAEELKFPLLQIARQAEHASMSANPSLLIIDSIQATADTALKLLDNYILGVKLHLEPDFFEQESVSVSSLLYDTKQELNGLAKSYGVELELNVAGKFGPVTANRKALLAALASMGAALIEALPANFENPRQLSLKLATHKSRYGIVAGVYSEVSQVSESALKSGRKLNALTRQPLVNFSHTSGAGIFVAETILKAMNLSLTSSRHHRLYGIATILQPNNQLQFV